MEKRQASVKAKLEVIQKTLSKLGLESGPAHSSKRGRQRVCRSKGQTVSRRLEGHWRDYVVVADVK